MESGASVTIADALKYLSMDMKIAPLPSESETTDDAENSDGEEHGEENPKPVIDDDLSLPKVRQDDWFLQI